MDVCCKCCVSSGRGLCDELISRPEESFRLWCVIVCDLENPKNEEAMTRVGSQPHRKKKLGIKRKLKMSYHMYRLSVHMICAVDTLRENFSLYKTDLIGAAAEFKFLSVLCNGILFI